MTSEYAQTVGTFLFSVLRTNAQANLRMHFTCFKLAVVLNTEHRNVSCYAPLLYKIQRLLQTDKLSQTHTIQKRTVQLAELKSLKIRVTVRLKSASV